MSRREELIWAAGLFEGEGCFSRNGLGYPTADISMSDEDSIRRFHSAIGFGTVRGPIQRAEWKPQWRWDTSGFERVQALLVMLWYGLGERRRARATELLAAAPFRDRTRCKNGHTYTGETTYTHPTTGARDCKICRRERTRRWGQKNNWGRSRLVNV